LSEGLTRYQVMDPLGEGGQGTTYRGVDRATDRAVAIKVLSLKAKRDWKSFDLFEREVAVLKSLSHPRIPLYIDSYASEDTGDFFLVMSLVDGVPLSRYIKESRRLPGRGLAGLLDEALSILEYLHGLAPPVIHRDIKPANMLLTPDGKLSLVDFGGVRLAARVEGGSTVIGTFGYMAPEQLHGSATQAVDVYGLGATLAAMHAGCEADALPHDGLRIDIESLQLPPELSDVIGRMVEPDPRLRLGTVAAVRKALAAQGRKLAPPRSRPADERPGEPRATRPDALARGPGAAAATVPRDVPAPMALLAQTPFPLSFLVWMVAALASGSLIVFEVVVLPLVSALASGMDKRSKSPERRTKLKASIEEMRRTVVSTRRAFTWVAGRTSPVGEDEPPPRR